jgi:DNA-binding CsgD family transcriptional regulator
MAWEWGQAAEMSATGQSADAALALEKFGDRQWDLGMRLAAASSYIMAAEIHPSPARLVRLERTQEVGGAGITARRGLVVARIAQDQVRLEVGARWMEAHGAHQTALEAWKHLHDLHEQNGNMSEANRSIEEVDRILGVQLANGTVSSGARRALSTLTVREREVVSLAAAGMTNPQIAAALYVNVRTVESHVHHAMRKTGVHSRQDLRDLALNIE